MMPARLARASSFDLYRFRIIASRSYELSICKHEPDSMQIILTACTLSFLFFFFQETVGSSLPNKLITSGLDDGIYFVTEVPKNQL